jgi:hypothetical protein
MMFDGSKLVDRKIDHDDIFKKAGELELGNGQNVRFE